MASVGLRLHLESSFLGFGFTLDPRAPQHTIHAREVWRGGARWELGGHSLVFFLEGGVTIIIK